MSWYSAAVTGNYAPWINSNQRTQIPNWIQLVKNAKSCKKTSSKNIKVNNSNGQKMLYFNKPMPIITFLENKNISNQKKIAVLSYLSWLPYRSFRKGTNNEKKKVILQFLASLNENNYTKIIQSKNIKNENKKQIKSIRGRFKYSK